MQKRAQRKERRRESDRNSEMIRLPLEVTSTLRRRARREDITVAQAAREILVAGAAERLTMLELVGLVRDRLEKRRDDLEELFEDEGADADAITAAIDALSELCDAWPAERADRGDDEETEED